MLENKAPITSPLAIAKGFKFNREYFFYNTYFSDKRRLMHGTIQQCDKCKGPMTINCCTVMEVPNKRQKALVEAQAENVKAFFGENIPETGGYNEDDDTVSCESCG